MDGWNVWIAGMHRCYRCVDGWDVWMVGMCG